MVVGGGVVLARGVVGTGPGGLVVGFGVVVPTVGFWHLYSKLIFFMSFLLSPVLLPKFGHVSSTNLLLMVALPFWKIPQAFKICGILMFFLTLENAVGP